LRAGLASTLEELESYPWCGHGVLTKKLEQPWQNIGYVLGLFSEHEREARRRYRKFVEKGISEGRRQELVGGGLLRSSGGRWALKELRKACVRAKGDERILGNSDFVEDVPRLANEAFEEKYELKFLGYDRDQVISCVAESMDIAPKEVKAFGKSPQTVMARPLLCFWAHWKLGTTTTEIARRLKITQPATSRLSKRGEQIEKECRLYLVDG